MDIREEDDYQPGQLVMRRNHAFSNKSEGFHAGMASEWLGLFNIKKKLGRGVYELESMPLMKVLAAELKPLTQPLRAIHSKAETGHAMADISLSPRHGYNLRAKIRK